MLQILTSQYSLSSLEPDLERLLKANLNAVYHKIFQRTGRD